jgi:probable nitrogen fixation protein
MPLDITDTDREALSRPFLKALSMVIRAEDRSGVLDDEPAELLLAPFIVTKAQKREIPMFGDPDPDILMRVDQIYQAICWLIETESGANCAPIMKIHHEGWGRIVIVSGRLVAVNNHVRELHRFGYESLAELEMKALALVAEGVAAIRKFPEVAAAT